MPAGFPRSTEVSVSAAPARSRAHAGGVGPTTTLTALDRLVLDMRSSKSSRWASFFIQRLIRTLRTRWSRTPPRSSAASPHPRNGARACACHARRHAQHRDAARCPEGPPSARRRSSRATVAPPLPPVPCMSSSPTRSAGSCRPAVGGMAVDARRLRPRRSKTRPLSFAGSVVIVGDLKNWCFRPASNLHLGLARQAVGSARPSGRAAAEEHLRHVPQRLHRQPAAGEPARYDHHRRPLRLGDRILHHGEQRDLDPMLRPFVVVAQRACADPIKAHAAGDPSISSRTTPCASAFDNCCAALFPGR